MSVAPAHEIQPAASAHVPRSLSTVVLDDPASVWRDAGAKSHAWFCWRLPVRIDRELLDELKRVAESRGRQNVRLCLHDSPQALAHDMIIVEHPGRYYRPHKHRAKGESYHLIEGSMGILIFDEQGQIIDACVLGSEGAVVYRVGADMYHAVFPLSERVVYHEAKPGPFLGEGDSVYPEWAPDGRDAQAVAEYTKRVRTVLDSLHGVPENSQADRNQRGR